MADNCGNWKYLGEDAAPAEPRILTRAEKNQALTHFEMDVNLASLLHTVEVSSTGELPSITEKPSREEEINGMYLTFSYAPVLSNGEELVHYSSSIVKVRNSTDEIRYMLSNETVPGTLDIQEDFHVSGSSFVDQDECVGGNLIVSGNSETDTLQVNKSAVVDGNLFISGNIYVNGVMFGNIAQKEYNSEGYAEPYERTNETPTGYLTSSVAPSTPAVVEKDYYTKEETYTRAEVNQKIEEEIGKLRKEIFDYLSGSCLCGDLLQDLLNNTGSGHEGGGGHNSDSPNLGN